MSKIRHSILIITFNQEAYIRQAIDSIFLNSVVPHEIIVGDDCSTDSTWSIICEYKEKYPNIFKIHRNEVNLGLIKNINIVKSMPTGDIVSCLAGDDFYCPGILDNFDDFIQTSNIDVKRDNFALISNTLFVYPDGKTYIYNNYPFRHKNLFKCRIRYTVDFRATGISINMWKLLPDFKEDLGYHGDWLYILDEAIYGDKFYFINKLGPAYRVGIGVTKTTPSTAMIQSKLQTIEYILEHYNNFLDDKDVKYMNKEKSLNEYLLFFSVKNFIKLGFYIGYNLLNYYRVHHILRDLKTLALSPFLRISQRIINH